MAGMCLPWRMGWKKAAMRKEITVRGKSQKGKNRIREHGETWRIVERQEKVKFSSETGPWLLLESLDGKCLRWMHETNDKDFSPTSPYTGT